MGSPRFEVPSGTIDGVNTVFTVSMPYRAGSTAVFLNGALQERSLDDGWFETDPDTGIITLKEAPRSSGACPDVLQVFYLDTAPPLPETQIFRLKGKIKDALSLKGKFEDAMSLKGVIDPQEELKGKLRSSVAMKAVIKPDQKLKAVICEVCL